MKILVVDDEPIIVEIIYEFINDELEAEVVCKDNGLDAYELSMRTKFDLILTDYQMPGLTGLDFIKKVRSSQGPNIDSPFILLTAFKDRFKDELENIDNIRCLPKPISFDYLLEEVQKALNLDA